MMTGTLDSDVTKTAVAAVVAWGLAKFLGSSIVAKRRRQLFEKVGTVDELYIYPLKSCGVMKAPDAFCSGVGLEKDGATDRHWMILTPNDSVVTMQEQRTLTLVTSKVVKDTLVVSAPGMTDLHLPLRPELDPSKTFIKIFDKQPIRVLDCGEEAGSWMSNFLHKDVKLVYSCPKLGTRDAFDRQREWDNTAKRGDKTIFSYLTSYLVTASASLKEVNKQLDTPVGMVNFRPNIVINNSIPFDEDTWDEMLIGDNVLFHSVEPCIRCTITTIDPDTAVRDKRLQPLKHLRSFRCRAPFGKAPVFGNYMSVDSPGHIKVGDPVFVLRKASNSHRTE